MAIITSIRDADSHVVRVGCLIKVVIMTIPAEGGGALVAARMAFDAGDDDVGTCKRKIRVVMIEPSCGFPGWMAGIACLAVVYIPTNALVLIIHICLVMLMAVYATEKRIIRWVGMAFVTRHPFTLVFSTIYWEVFTIVVKGGRYPVVLRMT